MAHTLNTEIKFSNPGIYHIRVQGHVRQELWAYFEGEVDNIIKDDSGKEKTTLKVHVRDQAELAGLINMLYDWRLVLLSVKMEGLPEDTGP
ncbi:MAG: hypothetical protein HC819_10425 [Cyclobacteriaceae bacterium]|nr:hypothetical protein [Cyclobacteriaceae bacterium]